MVGVTIKTVKIYTLEHPITQEIRYVGKTTQTLNRRCNGHISKRSNAHVTCWVKSLKKQNLFPKIQLLDEVDYQIWAETEKYWISQLRTWGFNLCNHSDGGESGREGVSLTQAQKDYLSVLNTGRTMSEQSKLIIAQKVSAAWRRKQLAQVFKYQQPKIAKEQYVFTQDHKTNIKNRLVGRKLPQSVIDKMVETRKKSIQQCDNNGSIIKSWDSAKTASEVLNINSSTIRHCLRGSKKTAGGFKWSFCY